LSDPAKQVTEKCPALKINELRIVRPCKFHELRNVRTEKCPYFQQLMRYECFSTTVLSVSRDHKMAAVNLSILGHIPSSV